MSNEVYKLIKNLKYQGKRSSTWCWASQAFKYRENMAMMQTSTKMRIIKLPKITQEVQGLRKCFLDLDVGLIHPHYSPSSENIFN